MSDPADPPRHVPTAVWLAEQQAKQARYAAQRRAWRDALARRAMPEPEERAPAADQAGAITPIRGGRRSRGIVHDHRQRKFDF